MRKIMRALGGLGVAAIVLLLSGCLLPEDFDATVHIHKDGSATFTYDGKLAFLVMLAKWQDQGTVTDKDRQDLQDFADALAEDPGFESVKYLDNARYAVQARMDLKPGESYAFPPGKNGNLLMIESGEDGTVTVRNEPADDEMSGNWKAVGINVQGILVITVDQGVEVLEQNAGTRPESGPAGDYRWQIKDVTDTVRMVVKTGA